MQLEGQHGSHAWLPSLPQAGPTRSLTGLMLAFRHLFALGGCSPLLLMLHTYTQRTLASAMPVTPPSPCCRWPGKFQLTLTIFRNADRKTQSYTRSSAFPAPELAEQPAPSTAQHAALRSGPQPGNTVAPSVAPEGGPASQLEAVVLANADSLQQAMAHAMPKGWNLVQLEMAATNFGAFKRFDAPTIRRFLSKAALAAAHPEVSLPPHADDCLTAAPQPKSMAQQPDNADDALAPPISVAEPDSSLEVDLSRISSAEQRFLLRQYETGKKRKQPAELRPGTKAKLAASKGQQQTISALFGRLK